MIDLTGQRFGKLVVLNSTKERRRNRVVWQCICDCGNKYRVTSDNLRSGNTQSCGCSRQKHGMWKTSEYEAWQGMIQRCKNPNNTGYEDYGGRGISVSEEFHDFQIWYEHIGPKPNPEHTQDRINNDGNYESGNIRWATKTEQQNNRRPISCGPCKQKWFRAWHIDSMVQEIGNNQQAFARKWKLSYTCICSCLCGRQKFHKGWRFEKVETKT